MSQVNKMPAVLNFTKYAISMRCGACMPSILNGGLIAVVCVKEQFVNNEMCLGGAQHNEALHQALQSDSIHRNSAHL